MPKIFKFKFLLSFIYFLSLQSICITSSNGISGSLNTQTASFIDESSLIMQIYRGVPDRRLSITAAPFDWMEASIFYVDIAGRAYGAGFNQSYKDKGFNIKFKLKDEGSFPSIAIGLNDFAGTGIYNSEYISLSKSYNNFYFNIGTGWGNFSKGIKLKNPFILIDKNFANRSELIKDQGGALNFETYFRGKYATLFGSVVYRYSPKLDFIFEIDPYDRNQLLPKEYVSYGDRSLESKTKVNLGTIYKFNKNLSFVVAIERGEEFTAKLSFSEVFNNSYTQKDFIYLKEKDQLSRNRQIERIMQLNDIGVIEFYSNEKKSTITVKQNSYQDINISNSYVYAGISAIEGNLHNKEVEINQKFLDMDVYSVKTPSNSSFSFKNLNSDFEKANDVPQYRVKERFPFLLNSIGLSPRFFLAGREGFLYRGLFVANDSEIIFRENLILTSNFQYSLSDNFDGLYLPPVDTYPAQVRSDIKKYLNNADRGIKIGRLQLDYFKNYDDNYFQLTAGLLEEMFSGIVLDYLYSPQSSFFSFGLEHWYVKKRDYNGKFGHFNYRNYINRAKIILREPQTKIISTFSFGEYLAGDKGYTLDLAKRFSNGVKFSIFFSKTNVPPELFGEGSFDKGIRLSIPLNFVSSNKNISRYEWHPLTKDPASLLVRKNTLQDLLERYRN